MDSKNQIKNMVEKLSQKVNPESVSIKDTCTKKSVENILKETQKKLDVVYQRHTVLTNEMMMANINKMRALKGIHPVADLPVIRHSTVRTYPVLYEGSCRDDGAWIEGVWRDER